MVTVPGSPEVTRPVVGLTEAAEGSLLLQVTEAPDIIDPFWSRTEADNWVVAPLVARVADDGDTATVVATSVGAGSVPPLELHPESKRKPGRTQRTRNLVKRLRRDRRTDIRLPGESESPQGSSTTRTVNVGIELGMRHLTLVA